ncbi:MAG: hypothetical protein ABIH11_08950 [Candidatus Altiarchaeota archaeon]
MPRLLNTPGGPKPLRYDKQGHELAGLDDALSRLEADLNLKTPEVKKQVLHAALKHVSISDLMETSKALRARDETKHVGLSLEAYMVAHRMGDLGESDHKAMRGRVMVEAGKDARVRDYSTTLQQHIKWTDHSEPESLRRPPPPPGKVRSSAPTAEPESRRTPPPPPGKVRSDTPRPVTPSPEARAAEPSAAGAGPRSRPPPPPSVRSESPRPAAPLQESRPTAPATAGLGRQSSRPAAPGRIRSDIQRPELEYHDEPVAFKAKPPKGDDNASRALRQCMSTSEKPDHLSSGYQLHVGGEDITVKFEGKAGLLGGKSYSLQVQNPGGGVQYIGSDKDALTYMGFLFQKEDVLLGIEHERRAAVLSEGRRRG